MIGKLIMDPPYKLEQEVCFGNSRLEVDNLEHVPMSVSLSRLCGAAVSAAATTAE